MGVWTCFVCGGEVVPGQRFTFLSKGPVHLECLEREVKSRGLYTEDTKILFSALLTLLDNIVFFRELKAQSKSDEVRNALHELQKSSETGAAKITRAIEKRINLD